jgi:hypothetical protein
MRRAPLPRFVAGSDAHWPHTQLVARRHKSLLLVVEGHGTELVVRVVLGGVDDGLNALKRSDIEDL